MILVRVARPDDAAAVDQVLQASYPALLAGVYEAALLEKALPLMARSNPRLLASETYYLAEADGQPVGCGGWTFDEPGTGVLAAGTAHIRHFAVSADWIGKGIGRQLFERCEADARAAGAIQFLCFSTLNGTPFYSALGFRVEAEIEVPMGPDVRFPSVLMRRSIQARPPRVDGGSNPAIIRRWE